MEQRGARIMPTRYRRCGSAGTLLGGLASGLLLLLSLAGPVMAQPILESSCTSGVYILTTCGTPATKGFLIRNLGDQTLNLGSLSFIGPNAGDFSAVSNCSSLPVGGPICGISITFTPHSTADSFAVLVVTSNDPTSPFMLPVQGHIWNTTSTISLSPSPLTFTSTGVGNPSGSQSLTITNTSTTASATIGGAGVSGPNAGDFSFSPPLSTLSGMSLGPGASQSVSVTFTPSGAGSRSATVTVSLPQSSGSGCEASASLAGNVTVPVCSCNISPGSRDFGTSAGSQTFMVMNTGTAAFTINSIGLSGDASFMITNQPANGTMLQPNQTASITVSFTVPTTPSKSVQATLTVSSGTNCLCMATMTGASPPPPLTCSCSLTPGTHDFGMTAGSQTFTLKNTGTAAFTINSIGLSGDASFTIINQPANGTMLQPNQTASITVSFTVPTTPSKSVQATLTVSSGTNCLCMATMTGSSPPPPATCSCSLTPGSHDFGMTAGSQTFTLKNTGTAAFTINSIGLSGDASFMITNQPANGTMLQPNQTASITVGFTVPSASNSSVHSTLTVNSGTACICTASLSGRSPCVPVSISCPPDLRVCLPEGECSASGITITPKITPNDPMTIVTCVRSDGQPLSAPYPFGTTTITCTAKDVCGNTATCTQHVTVDPGGQIEVNMTVVGGSDQVTMNVGDCISLQMLLTVAGCPLVQDVTGSTVFSTDPPHGTFHGNVFCATAADANHAFPIFGVYFNPCSGTFVTDTVHVTVRPNSTPGG